MKLVYTLASGVSESNLVEVQVLSAAPRRSSSFDLRMIFINIILRFYTRLLLFPKKQSFSGTPTILVEIFVLLADHPAVDVVKAIGAGVNGFTLVVKNRTAGYV